MERFKSEKIYPRIFAIIIAIITCVIAIYSIVIIIGEIRTIFPISKSGYLYLLENGCVIISLLLLAIYLLGYYGREKSNLYNISLILLIVYLSIPVIEELINSSWDFFPSKLSLAKMFFRIIMVMALFLLLAENREKRDGKIQIFIFGTILATMFLGLIFSTSAWIAGGYEDKVYFWRTSWEVFVENIHFLPFIFCAYFCSKNYSILSKAKDKDIELQKPLFKRIKKKKV